MYENYSYNQNFVEEIDFFLSEEIICHIELIFASVDLKYLTTNPKS